MNPEGQHLTMDIWLGDRHIDCVVDGICAYVRMTFNVVKSIEYKFTPQGRTVVYILSESHFTVHTYPEHNYITLDIYICNPVVNLSEVTSSIVTISAPEHYNVNLKTRGYRE